LSFAVATDEGRPVVDAAWLDAQIDAMNRLYGPLGIRIAPGAPARARALPARFARVMTRDDRDALAGERRPHVVNVFLTGALGDVDEPGRMRRGVHWRSRADSQVRYVILSAIAMPGVLAHEMGHYFGLFHTAIVDNLMSYERTGGDVSITASQGRTIQAAAREVFRTGELRGITEHQEER
jgi:hypothetical protein